LKEVKVIEDTTMKTFGLVATQEQGCVLTFRGTKNARNTISDMDISATKPYSDCPDCALHTGFYKAWRSLAGPARAALQELGCEDLRISGHSLGASMAVIAAFELADSYKLSGVYTYGQPRTGNEQFVAAFSKRLATVPYFRVVNYRDPIPHLLPDNLGYCHQTPEVYYHATELGAYAVCGEAKDKACSYHWNIITTSAHGCLHCSYLGLNPCDCDNEEPRCHEGSLISLGSLV
jgi:predicted lipase